ncbi:hypothetical protein OPQ81_007328 [Rhizoctonia solani]|nr:hypothetical protein OPQ81_007328 [Rhizoctonia solani]
MTKASHTPCNTCAARAATNPSGKAKCNGKAPCTWCKNKKLVCSYEREDPPRLHFQTTPEIQQSLPVPHETTILLINKPDGSHTIKFAPDPENLREVDTMEASDFYLPGDPPIEGYMALVNDRKRKHRDELTHAKRI